METKDEYLGDEIIQVGSFMKISHPIEHGIIRDWDDIEKLWNHTFYVELRVSPDEHPILLT